jgi:hypothetical protein
MLGLLGCRTIHPPKPLEKNMSMRLEEKNSPITLQNNNTLKGVISKPQLT